MSSPIRTKYYLNSEGISYLKKELMAATGHDWFSVDELNKLNLDASELRNRNTYSGFVTLKLNALKTLTEKDVTITIDVDTCFSRDWTMI